MITYLRVPVFFFAVSLVFATSGVLAQQTEPSPQQPANQTIQLSPADALRLIAELIIAGKIDEAESALNQVTGRTGDCLQEQFLAAQIAIRQNRLNDALAVYDSLIAADPSQTRIRIERARLLVAMGRVAEANTAFRELRQSALSANTLVYIDRYLSALRQRQPWTLQFAAAAGYDSNASAGPDQDTVTLFGLPFTLSEEAQQQGAATATLSGSGSYKWSVTDTADLRVSGGLRHTDVEGRTFDDTLASGQIGITRPGERTSFSAFATGYRRWFGGDGFSHALGGQGIADYRATDTLRLSVLLSVQDVDYDTDKNRNGLVTNVTLRGLKSLGQDRAILFFAGVIVEDARAKALENVTVRVGGAFINRWSTGVRLSLRPEIAYREFDGIQPAFGIKRADWRYTGTVELAAPPVGTERLSPFAAYTFTRNDSNIDFNTFTRHQVRAGLSITL